MPLNPAQEAFFKDTSRYCGMTSGLGGGKTYIAVRKHIALAMLNPGCISVCAEPTMPMVKDIILPSVEEALEELGIPYKKNVQDKKITLPNGHIILFRSGDRPTRIEGIELSHATPDEAALYKDEFLMRLDKRVRDNKARLRQFAPVGTPDGCKGWFFEKFGGPDASKNLHKGSTKQNLDNLGEEYLEVLEELPPDLQEQFINGEFVDHRTPRVYKEFNRDRNASKPLPLEKDLPVYIGLDFNVNPGMHFLAAQEHGREVWIVKEFYIPRGTTPEVCRSLEEWKQAEGLLYKPIIICDAAGRAKQSASGFSDHDILRNSGYEIYYKQIKTQSDKHNPVKIELHNNRLLIDPSCKVTIDSLLRYSYKEGSNIPEDDKYKHMMDALGYLMIKLRPTRKPLYGRG